MFTDAKKYYGEPECLSTGGTINAISFYDVSVSGYGEKAEEKTIETCVNIGDRNNTDNTFGYKYCFTKS